MNSIGALVSNIRLVLQLVSGLTKAYKNVGTNIRQSKPMPTFTEARSSLRLRLEEKAIAEIYEDSPSTMVAETPRDFDDSSSYGKHSGHNRGRNKHSKGNGSGKKHEGGGYGNSGVKFGRGGGGRGSGGNQVAAPTQQQRPSHVPWQWGWLPKWTLPPCPYPFSGWARPTVAGPTRAFLPQQ